MPDSFDFSDLAPASIPVMIGTKSYVLREATHGAVVAFRNAVSGAARMNADGKPVGVSGLFDAEPLLVSLCLSHVTDRGETPVPIQAIKAMPDRVVEPLFKWIKANTPSLADAPAGETKGEAAQRAADLGNGQGSPPKLTTAS